jgi:GNAT superfamily N-acetyltransferase
VADVTLRLAGPEDVSTILSFIQALAAFEHLSHEVEATEEDLSRSLFGSPVRAEALLAEQDGRALGFALWFYNFSTFRGRHGLFVEDVYIDPAHREADRPGPRSSRPILKHAVPSGVGLK